MSPEHINPQIQAPEHTLFSFHDLEGNQQLNVVKEINRLTAEMKEKIPGFVGIGVAGSTFKGYAEPMGKKISDLDFYLFHRNPINSESPERVVKAFEDIFYPDSYAFQLHPLKDVNVDEVLTDENILYRPGCLTGLIFPFFGNIRILNETIEKIKNVISKLSPEDQENWAELFANMVTSRETVQKVRERLPKYSNLSFDEYRHIRQKLYLERIKGLFLTNHG